MKALLINSFSTGGAERIVLNIFKKLKDNDIMLICIIKENNYDIQEDYNITYLSKLKSFRRGFSLSKVLSFPIIIYRLYKIIKKNKINIVQSHLYSSSIINIIVKLLGAGHMVQIVNHSNLNYDKSIGVSGKFKFAALKFTYNRADLIVSISKKMNDEIAKFVKPTIKQLVIPNPHDIEEITRKALEPVSFKFEQDKFYIITVGRLIESKKVDILIRAFSKIKNKNVELLIVGDGKERANLENICNNLSLSENVHFIGFTPNPFAYMYKSDLFIMTSESEGLPNVLFEAMICRTNIISTDCRTGPREIIAPDTNLNTKLLSNIELGKHGFLIPVNNESLLIEAIEHVFNMDSREKERLKTTAYNFALSFSIESISEIYNKVLSGN